MLPSEGAKPPEEERAATLASAEGPMSPELMGVAASDPAVGFKSPSRHHVHSFASPVLILPLPPGFRCTAYAQDWEHSSGGPVLG